MLAKKFCPRCRSEDVDMMAGGITGTWMCRNCGYSGSVFPEKEIIGMEQKVGKKMNRDKKLKTNKIKVF